MFDTIRFRLNHVRFANMIQVFVLFAFAALLVVFTAEIAAAQGTQCPGYQAKNVVQTGSGLVADLTLAGDACNLYSNDIANLRLTVEYQTGKDNPAPQSNTEILTQIHHARYPPSRLD